jgi:hypothetical protein
VPDTARSKLIKELQELRNAQGATLPRIAQRPTLVSLARLWRQTHQADGDAEAARELLKRCIEDLHARERDLFLAQFGFTYHQASREQRDAAYLEAMHSHGGRGSVSSLDRWARVGLDQLADRIVDRATGGGAHAVGAPQADMAGEPFLMEASLDRYRFREGRVLRDLMSERVIKCLVPGDHLYLAHHVYYADKREGALHIEPEFGCRRVDEFFDDGMYYCVLGLNKTLSVGETFRFSYRTHIRSSEPCVPIIRHTDEYHTGQWVLDIEFHEDAIPQELWTFAHVPLQWAPLRDHRRQVARPHDGSRYIRESWQGLRMGRSYGIEWQW